VAGVRATLGGARKRRMPRPLDVPAAGIFGAKGVIIIIIIINKECV